MAIAKKIMTLFTPDKGKIRRTNITEIESSDQLKAEFIFLELRFKFETQNGTIHS